MSAIQQIPRLLWSITDLTRYLRDIFENDGLLQDIWVLGEVSNLARPASGHIYFTLKDQNSALRCVMWRTSAAYLRFLPKDGHAVEAHGRLNIYEVGGQYQLYVDNLRPAGEGALYQEFLRLKNLLESEGLFETGRKKPIPQFPQRIGVITSPTGAALRDILDTIKRRFPCVEVVIAPTSVQGVEAPAGIIAALEKLHEHPKPDVILLARGGGSIEDLWAFNDERVARSIAGAAIPVITGIGHETDFTIADFVSDLRAPTPTAAAELATPNRTDLLAQLNVQISGLNRVIHNFLAMHSNLLSQLLRQLDYHSPVNQVQTFRQQIDELLRRVETSLFAYLQFRRQDVRTYLKNLEALNPISVLQRGYAIIQDRMDGLVTSIAQVQDNDELGIRLRDGQFIAIAKIDNPSDNAEKP